MTRSLTSHTFQVHHTRTQQTHAHVHVHTSLLQESIPEDVDTVVMDDSANTIEDNCAAVLAEHEATPRKRKRGRPRKHEIKKTQEKTVPTPLAMGRRTRMSTKVAEFIDECNENVNDFNRKKKQLQAQLDRLDEEIECEQDKAAKALNVASIKLLDAMKTKSAQAARRDYVRGKGNRRRKLRCTRRVPYTRTQLRNALECLVRGHKASYTSKSAERSGKSSRRAAILFMDGKRTTLNRILKKHDVIAKIKAMSL